MIWFKKKPATVRAPFPMDRVTALGMILPLSAISALDMRSLSALTWEELAASSFFNSYLCAYPRYLETDIDERLGGPVRVGLLQSILRVSEDVARKRFEIFCTLLDRKDRMTLQAFQLGQADGTSYFRALVESREADDTATENLRLAIRGHDDFSPLGL